MEGMETDEDETARAYAAIQAQLAEFTSPRVAATTTTSDKQEDVMMNWDSQQQQQASSFESSPSSTTTPQKRSFGDGSSTPIMSNAAKKQQVGEREPSPLALSNDDDDNIIMDLEEVDEDGGPVGIQSPWVERQQHSDRIVVSDKSSDVVDFQRYHEALLTYLVARRNLSHRWRIHQEQAQLPPRASQEQEQQMQEQQQDSIVLHKEEERVELDYLSALSATCLEEQQHPDYDDTFTSSNRSVRESNFWSLLATLRSLGMESLLFPDDVSSKHQQTQAIQQALQQIALQTEKTPAEIIHQLSSSSTQVVPIVLKRRKLLLEWMEQCQEHALAQISMPSKKQTIMWPASLERFEQHGQRPQSNKIDSLHPDAPLLVQERNASINTSVLYGNDEENDAHLLRACLALILAGQLDQAMELCRQCGQSWRAAAWGGGTPHGVVSVPNPSTQLMEKTQVGNVHRALWKRQCWKLSQNLSSKQQQSVGSSCQYEVAIYALLANDVNTALVNPVLGRHSWERGMQAVFSAMMGRVEDDLLYRHNVNRRRQTMDGNKNYFPFPATQYETEEKEQLYCTGHVANLTEADAVASSARHDSMQNKDDPLRAAMASFIIGKTAVSQYIQEENTQMDETDQIHLRFLTHLVVYLDSLSASLSSTTATPVLPGLDMVKNAALLQYVRYLASRPDLWRMLALYASLLPTDTLLECYPTFLSRVESDVDRRVMLQQARELFPQGLDLVILKSVVRMLLYEQQDDDKRLDLRKMKAVLWLCYFDQHMGDALICANILLRQFLVGDHHKIQSAIVFLDQFFPDEVVETVVEQARHYPDTTQESNNGGGVDEQDLVAISMVKNAIAEHGALQCYLLAHKAFEDWKKVVASTSPIVTDVTKHNHDALTKTEVEIAQSMERRDVIRQKRRVGQAVVEAADTAREKLMEVLTYPGGFLTQDDENYMAETEEEVQRRDELVTLRSRCLPRAVFMLHHVYDETASWMTRLLDDAVPRVGYTSSAALSALDDVQDLQASPLAPIYWIHQDLSLAETVAMDAYNIYDAFGTEDTTRFLEIYSEAAVKKLQLSVEESEL